MMRRKPRLDVLGWWGVSWILQTAPPLDAFRSSHHRSVYYPVSSWKRQGRTSAHPHMKNTSQSDSQDKHSVDTYYSPNVPLANEWQSDDVDDDNYGHGMLDESGGSMPFNEYSFFDEAILTVRAGSGGQGASTYKKGVQNQNGPADGGNGGQGGNVILKVDPTLNTLAGLSDSAWRPNSFGGSGAAVSRQKNAKSGVGSPKTTTGSRRPGMQRPKFIRAPNGADGMRQFKSGKYGEDVVVTVPPGTVVQEKIFHLADQDEMTTENVSYEILGTLTAETDTLVVALGGEGGEGSGVAGARARRPRSPPTAGERKVLQLILKIVADVSIVGVPNAGKSTFLAAVTRAKPKIANYPFTTIIPNLGVWIPADANHDKSNAHEQSTAIKGAGSDGLVLCDVPGLIAGAARGVGLGHAFLRHVERCHVMVHLVDASSNDPVADYRMLNAEICRYGLPRSTLADTPQVVVVNKIDVFDDSSNANTSEQGLKVRWTREKLEQDLSEAMPHTRLMWMSARDRQGVDDIMEKLVAFVKKVKAANEDRNQE